MALDLMRDKAAELPVPPDVQAVAALRIWHCTYRTLQPLERFRGLETLVVATWPDRTLEILAGLDRLTYLSLLHLPKATDLAPLALLPSLRHLELFGLVPEDGSMGALRASTSLESVRVHGFAERETTSSYEASGVSDDFAPPPPVHSWT